MHYRQVFTRPSFVFWECATSALFVLLLGWVFVDGGQAARFWAETLNSSDSTESVWALGREYKVLSGEVFLGKRKITGLGARLPLKLAYAATLLRRNPLFALAGTDPDLLLAETRKLAKIERDYLMEARKWDSEEASFTPSFLYPIRLLAATAKLEKARQKFLDKPSVAGYSAYGRQLRALAGEFQQDTERFRRLLRSSPFLEQTYLDTLASRVTPEGWDDGMEAAKTGFHETYAKALEREKCLAGSAAYCQPKDVSLRELPAPLPEEPPRGGLPTTVKEIMSLYAELGNPAMSKPVVALEKSFCAGSLASPYYFALYQKTPDQCRRPYQLISATSEELETYLVFLGDIFFQKIPLHLDNLWLSSLRFLGAEYQPHSPSEFYSCLDAAADRSRVLSVWAIRDFALANPRLAPKESSLLSNKELITEVAAIEFLREAMKNLVKTSPGSPEMKTLTEISLGLANNSRGLEQFVANISGNTARAELMRSHGLPVTRPVFLLLGRSSFASLHMFRNESFFGKVLPSLGTKRISSEPNGLSGLLSYQTEKYSRPRSFFRTNLEASMILHRVPSISAAARKYQPAPSDSRSVTNY
ncbi:MAG: hypothetical protein AAB597_01145 [Patescibacteria group bacterium]